MKLTAGKWSTHIESPTAAGSLSEVEKTRSLLSNFRLEAY